MTGVQTCALPIYKSIGFICQDITALDLYGTVDVMICFMDTVNHITDIRKVRSFFRSCKRFLDPGGLLIFDIATEKHFAVTLGDKTFAEDSSDHTLIWSNSYNKAKALNKADITVFSKLENGLFCRNETEIRERYYPPETIISIMTDNELEVKAIYSDLTDHPPGTASERIFFVVRNDNDPQKNSLLSS